MPVKVVKRGDKYRIVEEVNGEERIVKTGKGNAVDGGGHKTREEADRQARAINRSLHNAGKI